MITDYENNVNRVNKITQSETNYKLHTTKLIDVNIYLYFQLLTGPLIEKFFNMIGELKNIKFGTRAVEIIVMYSI